MNKIFRGASASPMPDDMHNASELASACPRCDAMNARARKYCAQCGTPLWETCLRCGEVCASGESYCGSCGVNLDEAAAERLERIDAAFRDAAERHAAGRYDEAKTLLEPITKHDHPRLAERAERARRLAQQWAAERQRAKVAAAESLQEARRLFDAADYAEAARRLASVPAALGGEERATLQSEIDARLREIADLEKDLQEAIREKRTLDLPPTLERLLALKPDHVGARRLASQVARQLTRAAENRLSAHDYDGAMKLLDAAAPLEDQPRLSDSESRNGRFCTGVPADLRRRAAELSCLAWDLRAAPTVDAALAAAAEKMRLLAPDDPKVVQSREELRRRIAAARDPRRIEPIAWARPPRETPLGIPVEWSVGWRRIDAAPSLDVETLRRNPGRFQTACGLALSALGRGALEINLLAGEGRKWSERLAGLARGTAAAGWGIDLGSGSLKAVRLVWASHQAKPTLDDAVVIEYAKPLGQAANEIEESRLISESLEKLLQGRRLKGEGVCVSFPGRMALCRMMDLPPVAPHKARSLVEFEARNRIDFPLDQLLWDYSPLRAPPADGHGEKPGTSNGCRALWVAVKRHAGRRYLEMFRRLKFQTNAVQPDFIALHNFLMHEYFAEPGGANGAGPACLAALDVGCDATHFVVSAPDTLWFRGGGVAGHSFTRALAKERGLTLSQAEQRKRSPETAESFAELERMWAPLWEELLRETRDALDAFARTHPGRAAERIVGLGGGFALHGLYRYLLRGR